MTGIPPTQRPASTPQAPPPGDPQLRHRNQPPQQQQQQRPGMGPPVLGAASYGPMGLSGLDGPRPPRVPPAILLEAATNKVLVPSLRAVYALLAVPLVLWAGTVVAGVLHAEPVPEDVPKHQFEHPLIWFDRHVFRVYGPLLPLAPLLLRWVALAFRAPFPSPSTSTPARKPAAAGDGFRPLRPAATLPLWSLAVYGTIIVVRIVLYLGHVALQQSSRVALVSDHLLLAASVVACFQAELVMCLSDVFKVELLRGIDPGADVRQVAVVTAMVTSMFLLVFVYGDMYCTARWYHEPTESVGALLAGVLMFQGPVAVWVLSQAKEA